MNQMVGTEKAIIAEWYRWGVRQKVQYLPATHRAWHHIAESRKVIVPNTKSRTTGIVSYWSVELRLAQHYQSIEEAISYSARYGAPVVDEESESEGSEVKRARAAAVSKQEGFFRSAYDALDEVNRKARARRKEPPPEPTPKKRRLRKRSNSDDEEKSE